MVSFARTRLKYQKVGYDEYKREYGNITSAQRIVAMGVEKVEAALLIKRFNTFASRGIFKGQL